MFKGLFSKFKSKVKDYTKKIKDFFKGGEEEEPIINVPEPPKVEPPKVPVADPVPKYTPEALERFEKDKTFIMNLLEMVNQAAPSLYRELMDKIENCTPEEMDEVLSILDNYYDGDFIGDEAWAEFYADMMSGELDSDKRADIIAMAEDILRIFN